MLNNSLLNFHPILVARVDKEEGRVSILLVICVLFVHSHIPYLVQVITALKP